MPTERVDGLFQEAREFSPRYPVLQYDNSATIGELNDEKATMNGLNKIATVQDGLGCPVTLIEVSR